MDPENKIIQPKIFFRHANVISLPMTVVSLSAHLHSSLRPYCASKIPLHLKQVERFLCSIVDCLILLTEGHKMLEVEQM